MEAGELCNDCCKPRRTEVFIQWIAPPKNLCILNTVRAAKGNPGLAGGGGLIRDSQGTMMQAFMEKYGSCTSVRIVEFK